MTEQEAKKVEGAFWQSPSIEVYNASWSRHGLFPGGAHTQQMYPSDFMWLGVRSGSTSCRSCVVSDIAGRGERMHRVEINMGNATPRLAGFTRSTTVSKCEWASCVLVNRQARHCRLGEGMRTMSVRANQTTQRVGQVSGSNAMRRIDAWCGCSITNNETHSIHCYTDSDHGGCAFTRRSTSGGLILHGRHLIHMWSSMQSTISSSSAECENYAVLKGAETLFVKSLCSERRLNHGTPKIRRDSSAGQAMATRKGVGGEMHLEIPILVARENAAEPAHHGEG